MSRGPLKAKLKLEPPARLTTDDLTPVLERIHEELMALVERSCESGEARELYVTGIVIELGKGPKQPKAPKAEAAGGELAAPQDFEEEAEGEADEKRQSDVDLNGERIDENS